MTDPLSPLFPAATITTPTLPALQLSDDDAATASVLAQRLFTTRGPLEVADLYYDGLQKMQDLGISIPPQLKNLRTIIGWPTIGVDAVAERVRVEGFRYPDATDTDEDLWDIWQGSNMDLESQLAQTDALIFGRSYLVIGPGDDSTNGNPLITAESPMNLTGIWNDRTKQCSAALQVYVDTDITSDTYGNECAALYLPDKTLQMTRQASSPGLITANGKWELLDSSDYHKMGLIPVVRMANRSRLKNRDGSSEVRASWMNTMDSVSRTLLGMEITREFYGAPKRYILGASEEMFQNPDGSPKESLDAVLSKIWAIPSDDDDKPPTVGQFAPSDPSVHTKLIDEYAKIMAGEMGVPPHMLGVYSDGNPASADAIRSGYESLTMRCTNKQPSFGCAYMDAMRIAVQISGKPTPTNAYGMEVDWMDPSPSTPAATSDAVTKQVQAGIIPATSDVTLKALGYTAAQRARLAQDRATDQGDSLLDELAHSILAKDAKVDSSLVKDIDEPPAPGTGVPPSPAVAAAIPPTTAPVPK